jgi:hypothetical protein
MHANSIRTEWADRTQLSDYISADAVGKLNIDRSSYTIHDKASQMVARSMNGVWFLHQLPHTRTVSYSFECRRHQEPTERQDDYLSVLRRHVFLVVTHIKEQNTEAKFNSEYFCKYVSTFNISVAFSFLIADFSSCTPQHFWMNSLFQQT